MSGLPEGKIRTGEKGVVPVVGRNGIRKYSNAMIGAGIVVIKKQKKRGVIMIMIVVFSHTFVGFLPEIDNKDIVFGEKTTPMLH